MKKITKIILVALLIITPVVSVRADTTPTNTCGQTDTAQQISCLTIQMLKLQIQLLTMQLNTLLAQQAQLTTTPTIQTTSGGIISAPETQKQVCTTTGGTIVPLQIEIVPGGGHVGMYSVTNPNNGTINIFATSTDGYNDAQTYAQQNGVVDPSTVKTVCQQQTPISAKVCTTTDGTKVPLIVKKLMGDTGSYGVFDKNGGIVWNTASTTDAYGEAMDYARDHGTVVPGTQVTICQ